MVNSLVSSAGQMHHVGDYRLARGVDRSAATVAVCQGRCSFLPVGGRDAAGVACADTHQLGRLIQCNLLRQQAVQNLKSSTQSTLERQGKIDGVWFWRLWS